MSEFEFLFALFGLVLGLSIVEVLGGLARTIEARVRPGSAVRIGWLTPALGLFVLLDLLSFWAAAWAVRDVVRLSHASMIGVTVFAGAYYLAAHLVFPRDPAEHVDLDVHFFRVRRIVLGVMLALLICQLGWYLSEPSLAPMLRNAWIWGMTAVLFGLMIAAIVVPGRRLAGAMLAALIARYLVLALW